MKFNESTECLVSSFIPFKYLERDLYIVPYLFAFVSRECEIPSPCEGDDLQLLCTDAHR